MTEHSPGPWRAEPAIDGRLLTDEQRKAREILLVLLRVPRACLELGMEVLPTLFIGQTEDAEYGVNIVGLGDFPRERIERHRALRAVGAEYARDARWVAFIADAWVKRIPIDAPVPSTLSDAPDREEAVVARWGGRDGDEVAIEQRYTRVPSDGRSAERIVWSRPRLVLGSTHDYDRVIKTVLDAGREARS